ncbi:glycosyltransferase family 2 protein [Rhodoplanes sp. SY1]|uniref:glycosyltransferase family 2 protein n=1 Tax=Rhodoplanes sp. SY1 TaxID=3166646 RepID=UPI0038B42A40
MNTTRPSADETGPPDSLLDVFATKRSTAVLLPCYNEERTVGDVIAAFRRHLPDAVIYVYDNNSTDRTAAVAARAGAVVRRERYQGKGNVMRRMFADVEADVFVLADGDLTYDASAAGRLIDTLVRENVDMVVGVRVEAGEAAYRRGHRFGNRMFNRIVAALFGDGFSDILSGYRVMSRRFVKSFPAVSSGFEVETELSVHALDLKVGTIEIPLSYAERPAGSTSKLKTYRDGFRILMTIVMMYRTLQPLRFYSAVAFALFALALALGAPVLVTYFRTGLVPRLPTAVLAAVIVQVGFLSMTCGIIIDAISASRRELKRMRYLDLKAPGHH